MSKIEYQTHTFRKKALSTIEQANSIITEYQDQGYTLTLRQLYYQFVARGFIANTQTEYKSLGVVINNARLAGLIDWESIIDRTRTVEKNSHFDDPGDILAACAAQFKLDTRSDQKHYIEVWIEKEALIGVIEPVCGRLDVTYLACRGYYSQSAMYQAGKRIMRAEHPVVLHFGDHDPSGVNMTKDIESRLNMFAGRVLVKRIALNMDQVEQYNPPPDFAKMSDTRAADYIAAFGDKSWELDALEPAVIVRLIEDEVSKYTDEDKRQARLDEQAEHRNRLDYIAEHWEGIGE